MTGPHPPPSVALVTGAGRGLGRELALALAGHGLRVAALGRAAEPLGDLARAAPEGRILPVLADVADPVSLRAAFARIDAAFGPLDTLINNAAIYPHRDFLDETPESFMQTVAVNLGGMASCAMLALERMVPRGHGRIVNITSFADLNPVHLASAYSVSKGAGRILTRAMVRDLADRFPDIVISDWIPGALNTGMGIPGGHDPARAARWGAALALWRDPALSGAVFVEDREQLPHLSLKRRLFNKLTGTAPQVRRLGGD
ncbi:SDR family oxidoreductase [Rhodovulum sp.]|uniref:SDR family oxidoreductase n=1 Tax=Rhodovulum sp. TaxID=34009 RepID=UPI00179DA968|nr:SDR family NAD(P)-dependent oxidoreductase [Rhodovulum sp.]HDR29061.1 SDR family oxidoreductase [Rhodovulum sp.]